MIFVIIGSILGGLLLLTIILLIIFEKVIKKSLYHRGDGDLRISYPALDESLTAERIIFKNSKNANLYGFIYKDKEVEGKELLFISHGIGGGHTYMRPFIKRYCHEGFIVIGYDNYASLASEGKRIVSMSQSIADLESAIRFITSKEEFKDMKINLVGHSWGGFAVLNSLNFKDIKIERIVSYAGFDSETCYYSHFSKGLVVLTPFIALRNFIKGGKYGLYSASRGLKHRKSTKVMYIQGTIDNIVTPEVGGNRFKKIKNPNLEVCMVEGKSHFPFMTKEAEKNALEILSKYGFFGGDDQNVNDNIQYGDLMIFDEELFNSVISFLKK